jgi:hypothetical protein
MLRLHPGTVPVDADCYRARERWYRSLRDDAVRAGDTLAAQVFTDRWRHYRAERRAAERR